MRRTDEHEARGMSRRGSAEPLARRVASFALAGSLLLLGACSDSPPPAPSQPIAFSHQAHAAQDIDCVRCHQGVETQAVAGLPPLSSCAACHRREIPDHPEVVKVMAAFQAREPIVWTKVNAMPATAMIHFKHKPHIRAGVECARCHGDVTQMTVAQRVINTADMGWCLDCHRESEAPTDCLTCHH